MRTAWGVCMTSTQDIYQDIEATLGHVPEFVREIPPEAVGAFWTKMKEFEMGETAIPNKYKDLIGVGVAAAIPCAYCVLFHKESARLSGATDEEIREAIMMAASTREGSTILNGMQQDFDRFKDEMREIVKHVRSQQRPEGQRART